MGCVILLIGLVPGLFFFFLLWRPVAFSKSTGFAEESIIDERFLLWGFCVRDWWSSFWLWSLSIHTRWSGHGRKRTRSDIELGTERQRESVVVDDRATTWSVIDIVAPVVINVSLGEKRRRAKDQETKEMDGKEATNRYWYRIKKKRNFLFTTVVGGFFNCITPTRAVRLWSNLLQTHTVTITPPPFASQLQLCSDCLPDLYTTRSSLGCVCARLVLLYSLDYFCLCIFARFSCCCLLSLFNWLPYTMQLHCCCGTHQMRRPSTRQKESPFLWCSSVRNLHSPTPLDAPCEFPTGRAGLYLTLYWETHPALFFFFLFSNDFIFKLYTHTERVRSIIWLVLIIVFLNWMQGPPQRTEYGLLFEHHQPDDDERPQQSSRPDASARRSVWPSRHDSTTQSGYSSWPHARTTRSQHPPSQRSKSHQQQSFNQIQSSRLVLV